MVVKGRCGPLQRKLAGPWSRTFSTLPSFLTLTCSKIWARCLAECHGTYTWLFPWGCFQEKRWEARHCHGDVLSCDSWVLGSTPTANVTSEGPSTLESMYRPGPPLVLGCLLGSCLDHLIWGSRTVWSSDACAAVCELHLSVFSRPRFLNFLFVVPPRRESLLLLFLF